MYSSICVIFFFFLACICNFFFFLACICILILHSSWSSLFVSVEFSVMAQAISALTKTVTELQQTVVSQHAEQAPGSVPAGAVAPPRAPAGPLPFVFPAKAKPMTQAKVDVRTQSKWSRSVRFIYMNCMFFLWTFWSVCRGDGYWEGRRQGISLRVGKFFFYYPFFFFVVITFFFYHIQHRIVWCLMRTASRRTNSMVRLIVHLLIFYHILLGTMRGRGKCWGSRSSTSGTCRALKPCAEGTLPGHLAPCTSKFFFPFFLFIFSLQFFFIFSLQFFFMSWWAFFSHTQIAK